MVALLEGCLGRVYQSEPDQVSGVRVRVRVRVGARVGVRVRVGVGVRVGARARG